MTIQSDQNFLLDESADVKVLQNCINELRRKARYVRYAAKIGYCKETVGKERLREIEILIQELAEKLMYILDKSPE